VRFTIQRDEKTRVVEITTEERAVTEIPTSSGLGEVDVLLDHANDQIVISTPDFTVRLNARDKPY